jgi:DNA primase
MAGRIPDSFLDELVARSDIVEVIGARVPLKKGGREYKACCPFHNEKSPSFWVSPDKQFYHCFGCGAHGTVIGFLMQYEKMEFLDAVADLALRAGMELPRGADSNRDAAGVDLHDVMARATRFFEQNLADNARAQRYIESRGIDATTAAQFAMGYAPNAWDALLNRLGAHEEERQRLLGLGLIVARDTRGGETAGFYDRFRDRLMFPIRDSRGRVIGFGGRIIDQGEPKYLNSPETPLFHKGRELYGLFEAKRARADLKRLLIVEGYMDVVRLHQAGITYAVATLGTATTPEHLNKIFKLTSEVVFCFDGDRAGRAAAWRALENSLKEARDGREFKFMFLPEGHDPDTLVAASGAAAFEERLKSAQPLSEYLVQHLRAEVDLDHVDGRARLKALVAPLLARMPEGIYRELLVERLAAEVKMPAAALKKSFAASPESRPAEPAGAVRSLNRSQGGRRVSAGRGNLLSQAIALLLHHPAAARFVDPRVLDGVVKPGLSVLQELLSQAAGMQQPSTASLLERWRDRTEYGRLCELAMSEAMVVETAGAAKELQMAVEKLIEESGPGRRLDQLLRKAEELGLNYQEKTELSLLLKARGQSKPPA